MDGKRDDGQEVTNPLGSGGEAAADRAPADERPRGKGQAPRTPRSNRTPEHKIARQDRREARGTKAGPGAKDLRGKSVRRPDRKRERPHDAGAKPRPGRDDEALRRPHAKPRPGRDDEAPRRPHAKPRPGRDDEVPRRPHAKPRPGRDDARPGPYAADQAKGARFKPRDGAQGGERKQWVRPRHDRPAAKPAADRRGAGSGVGANLPPDGGDGRERIAKVMARAGVASRRDAEAMIAAGRVSVNGGTVHTPALLVGARDRVAIDGQPMPAKERTRLWLYHKPVGLVTTARDPEARPTVFDNLPPDLPRVVSIGRLDIATEGLLLLTNDGGLARVLAHPETAWLRRYRVRAFGSVTPADLEPLAEGITIEGMHYGPIEAALEREQGDNVWLTLGLREGKNREVKRVLERLGLTVNRLIRTAFGPFQLGDLAPSAVEEVKTRVLVEQLGPALAKRAGVDFATPAAEPRPSPDARRHPRPFSGRRDSQRGSDGAPRRHADGAKASRPSWEKRGSSSGKHDGRGRGRPHPAARPAREDRSEARGGGQIPGPKRSTWRAEAIEKAPRTGSKQPRRGEDPKAARAASGQRERVRAGGVEDARGRRVIVERIVEASRPDSGSGKPRSAPAANSRPKRESGAEGRSGGAGRPGTRAGGAGGPGKGGPRDAPRHPGDGRPRGGPRGGPRRP